MAWAVFANRQPVGDGDQRGGRAVDRVCCTAVPGQSSSAGWLIAFGWAALALPRRDGLIWACVALVVALGYSGRTAASGGGRSASGRDS